MKLSKRLQMNADLVPHGAKVADIGCDHGYVSIYLAEKGKCRNVIAMDINQGPLEIARKNIELAGLTERIECRRSDGVDKLEPGEADTLMIAGMGGMLVCEILKKKPEVLGKINCLILQAQSDWETVRRLLPKLGFYIEKEAMCYDAGKYYIAIRAVRGQEAIPYSDTEYVYGRILPREKDSCYQEYLQKERKKVQQILNQLEQKQSGHSMARTEELAHILKRIDKTLDIMNGGAHDYNNIGE
ncbi:MAG: class I SAM-dependent methyltransferase [Eubacterium sp.]|nr:class I SAM-dependent methyltransferase [Eubacterium sp.]